MKTIAMPNGTNLTLGELIQNAEKEIVRLKYCAGTVSHYRTVWKTLMEFASQQPDGQYFSENLGHRFLREVYGFYPEMSINDNPQGYRHKRRAIRILGDLQLHGIILRHEMSKVVPWPHQFQVVMFSYMEYLRSRYLSETTVSTKEPILKRFVCYLNELMVKSWTEISNEHICSFSKTLSGYNPKTYNSIMVTIRQFLNYLYQEKYISRNLAKVIVLAPVYKNTDVPSAFTKPEIEKLISCIDRSSRTGKRDYAIILLAAKLGIRAVDIKNLKLGDINWDKKDVSFVQSKTNVPICLPLDNETGWAIIDYLKYARPQTDSENIFVRLSAPFEPYSQKNTFYNIIQGYLAKAKIHIPHGRRHGIHSLRHSLASALLEIHTPLSTISGILGHSDFNSTMSYLKIDTKGLMQCAIDPEEVFE